MAKKDKVNKTSVAKKEQEEIVIVEDIQLDDIIEDETDLVTDVVEMNEEDNVSLFTDSKLIESNVGSFEEEIMTVKEKVEPIVVEEPKKVEVKNNPNKFKRIFGYIWNGQICDE